LEVLSAIKQMTL